MKENERRNKILFELSRSYGWQTLPILHRDIYPGDFGGWSRVVWVCGAWEALPGNHSRFFVMAATHVTHIPPLRPRNTTATFVLTLTQSLSVEYISCLLPASSLFKYIRTFSQIENFHILFRSRPFWTGNALRSCHVTDGFIQFFLQFSQDFFQFNIRNIAMCSFATVCLWELFR